ncbi:hypothetical protein [Massilia sp. CF038]|uniref:hypothetical protein n=1 Tax=Massilia sp. CF038 TaxID=1881045 RepID=UPI000910B790|nr:hypothetical protein [Massilia sp. CF038]SHH24946.1 hypothetical protein SAMN05428948_3509 [Massilia sp. CF038]
MTMPTRSLTCAVVLATLLSACGRNSDAAAPTTRLPASPSYELVTEVRPESVSDFFKLSRSRYDGCVLLAETKKLPVQPFMTLPEDFVVTRTTYVSDGKSFFEQVQTFYLDDSGLTPEQGCATAIGSDRSASAVHKGMQKSLNAPVPGQTVEPPADAMVAAPDPAKLASYTLSKTIHGVQVKCAESGPADPIGSERCIVDPSKGVIARADGEPVLVNVRHNAATGLHNTLLITQPVKLNVGQHIDPAIFERAVK